MNKMNSPVAVAAMVIGCAPALSHAQNEDKLEHVLVTVPIHRTEAETALPVTVLTDSELRRQLANTIGETLNTMPGLSNASFGPAVGQPVIRGQQGARVTVLQNSTSSADASNISADHAVSVEPVLAKSIEVLRGPSTLLYGGGAIGGVVNVIDNRVPVSVPEKLTGAIEYRHSDVSDENTGVFSIEGGAGNFAFHIDGLSRQSNDVDIPGLAIIEREHDHEEHEEEEHEEEELENSDGFIANSDSDTRSLTVGGSFVFDRGYFGLAVNQLENEYGVPAGSHGHHEEEHEEEEHEEGEEHGEEEHGEEDVRLDIEQTRVDVRADLHDLGPAIENLRWFFTYTDYQHDELEGTAIGTRWSRESWENRIEMVHTEIGGWHGVLGLQIRNSELSAVGEESFIPKTDIDSYGLFIIEDYHAGDWTFELGARVDYDELDPVSVVRNQSFTSHSLSASALWNISDQLNVGLALSGSQRAPVVEELYSNAGNQLGDYVEHVATGVIEVGSTDLDSEQANNADLTVSYNGENVSGFVTLFYNDFHDYIFLNNTGQEQGEVPVLFYAQQDAEFTGVEFEVSWVIGSVLNSALSLQLFGDSVNGELDNGDDVPRMPPQRIGSRLQIEGRQLSAYLSVVDAAEQDKPGLNEFETDGYTRWDAGVSYRVETASTQEYLLFLRAKNLSDEEIRNSTSFLRDVAPESGRSIEAGIRFMF